jgi:hypothetical protein
MHKTYVINKRRSSGKAYELSGKAYELSWDR